MKKVALTIAIVLGMTIGAMAQGGGLFGKGASFDAEEGYTTRDGEQPMISLPGEHGSDQDQSPIGSGALLLIGFGAAYALKKRNEK